MSGAHLPIAIVRVRGGSMPAPGTNQEKLSFLAHEGWFFEVAEGGHALWIHQAVFDHREGYSIRNPNGACGLIALANCIALFGYWTRDDKSAWRVTPEPPATAKAKGGKDARAPSANSTG